MGESCCPMDYTAQKWPYTAVTVSYGSVTDGATTVPTSFEPRGTVDTSSDSEDMEVYPDCPIDSCIWHVRTAFNM
ncbi:hypothetical protein R1flu_028423 [Riccia fluitans]|uniref:Uncharacterized protein n=1 Tax=Riccia fluitans TaxID=41844 RepID=A0ABD1XM66_9MARC